jgi:hypothetical protein
VNELQAQNFVVLAQASDGARPARLPHPHEGLEVVFGQIAPGAVRAIEEPVFDAVPGEARHDKEAELVALRSFRQGEAVIAARARVASRYIV